MSASMVVADRTVRKFHARDAEGYICIVKNLNDGHRAIGEAVIILTSSLSFGWTKLRFVAAFKNWFAV